MVGRHGRVVGYNVQIGVDDKHKLLVAAEVTQDRCDANQLHPITEQVKQNMQLTEFEVIADKGYYNHEQIGKCLKINVKPWVPPQRQSQNSAKGLFTKAEFVYDPVEDTYTCPAGEVLRPQKYSPKNKWLSYRTKACKTCVLREKCTTCKTGRRVCRSRHENQIDELERQGKKNGFYQNRRKEIVEHPFGTIKTAFQFGTFLTKGLENVQTEMTLTALAYNLRRVLNTTRSNRLLNLTA